MIRVFHAKPEATRETFCYGLGDICPADQIKRLWSHDAYRLVAEVEGGQLSAAYRLTNHIEDSWWNNRHVRKVTETEERSTSVGDIMGVSQPDGSWSFVVVARFGFDPIELPEYTDDKPLVIDEALAALDCERRDRRRAEAAGESKHPASIYRRPLD